MKKNSGIIGFDDGMHQKSDLARFRNSQSTPKYTPLVAVVTKGLQLMHVSQNTIEVDGQDATQKILRLVDHNPYLKELQLILIDSPTLGGFNIPDPFYISKQLSLPVLLVPSSTPNVQIPISQVYQQVFPQRKKEQSILNNLPSLESLTIRINTSPNLTKTIYFHAIGISVEELGEILQYITHYSAVPEPLRLAHLIASSTNII